jgi:hypothetical protein
MDEIDKTKSALIDQWHAFNDTFNSESGKKVLDALERECHWTETTMHEIPHYVYALEGKRSVLLYIKGILADTPDKITERYEAVKAMNNIQQEF